MSLIRIHISNLQEFRMKAYGSQIDRDPDLDSVH